MSQLPKIYGFNKSSEMGIDVFAPTIFLGGCNLRCPYCINCRLVNFEIKKGIDIKNIETHVKTNKCEWINISGGEPTCSGEEPLINLFKTIKEWGCKIGLATNGINDTILANIIGHLDYVALDIKTSDDIQYMKISPDISDPLARVLLSQALLAQEKMQRNSFDYEIRTTLFPPFVNKDILKAIGSIIRKQDKWVLQKFRNNSLMLDKDCKLIEPYGEKEMEALVKIAKSASDNVFVRDV